MSFLDNLENNLKSLESREEADSGQHRRRESDERNARAIAPWAEKLKNGDYSKNLMQQATRAGFQLRTKVHIAWIGPTLRLEARGERLELRPAADGVEAVMLRGDEEGGRSKIDLDCDPEPLVRKWMRLVGERKRLDEEAVRTAINPDEEI